MPTDGTAPVFGNRVVLGAVKGKMKGNGFAKNGAAA